MQFKGKENEKRLTHTYICLFIYTCYKINEKKNLRQQLAMRKLIKSILENAKIIKKMPDLKFKVRSFFKVYFLCSIKHIKILLTFNMQVKKNHLDQHRKCL